jgi:uncharacterized protein (DUF1015 family)
MADTVTAAPTVDFSAPDGVRHSAWTIADPERIRWLEREFARLPALYIADGHHRTAAAARVYQARQGAGHSAGFLAVIFAHNQVQILPYNRALKDLNGLAPEQLWEKFQSVFTTQPTAAATPTRKHELGCYLAGRWQTLAFRPEVATAADPLQQLDVSLLQRLVLAPLFGIDDPRTTQRLQFVGGIRGTAELERLVDGGEAACAFSLYPTGIEDLMAIADQGGLMPPKSTWFEPKLRDGMFCHCL